MLRIVLPAAFLLASCVSGRDCWKAIPEDLRADTIRYAVETGMVSSVQIPEPDYDLALGAGTAPKQLTDERKAQIARYVAGYADCIKERIHRGM